VGSNSSHTSGDLYTLDKRYSLSDFAKQRNKRVIDVLSAALFILFSPVVILFIKHKGQFLANCVLVLTGSRTWISYSNTQPLLPPTRKGILPPYRILPAYEPDETVLNTLDTSYAQEYESSTDINLILANFKYLGGF